MATPQKTEQISFNEKLNEKLNEIMQKHRRVILFGIIAIVLALLALVAVITLRDWTQAKALSQVDGFNRRYEELKDSIQSEEPLEPSNEEELSALLEELGDFAQKSSGFASARAYSIIANIQGDQKNWAEAQMAWSASARAARRTYLAPISFFNAAVAAEEQGNIQMAIELYTEVLSHGSAFPAAARVQFSIGRLQESLNNREAALDAYRTLLGRWPDDPLWSNLAQSRIIVLSE